MRALAAACGLVLSIAASSAAAEEPQHHDIVERLQARIGVIDVAAAVTPGGGGEGARPEFLGGATLFDLETAGAKFEFLRVGIGVFAHHTRLAFSVARIDEIAIGANAAGKPCLPKIFPKAPDRQCEADSGLFGFGAGFMEADSLSRFEDFTGESIAIRAAEVTARLLVPGGALGPHYQRFHLPIYVGTALDWIDIAKSDSLRVVPRLTTGLDLGGRSEDAHLEAKASFVARPSMIEWGDDLLLEASARITARFIAPWETVASMQAVTLETGYGYASRPVSVIGEHLSKTDRDSAWMILRYEVTLESFTD